jgi:hypothetical protein
MINFSHQYFIIKNQTKRVNYRLFQAAKYCRQSSQQNVKRQKNNKKSHYIVLNVVILVFWLSMTFNLEFIGMIAEVTAEESTAEETKGSDDNNEKDNKEKKESKEKNNKNLTGHKKPKKKT